MKTEQIISVIDAIYSAITNHEADIESLDRAIGDGDHYINMRRGTEAIVNMKEEIATLEPADALNKIGMKLLSTIGGASGPLFASFFLNMSKTLKINGDSSLLEIAAAFAAGVQAIMQRGKADVGEKTMLDVLVPVSTTFTQMAAKEATTADICDALCKVASDGLESTREMIATKGRAAGLGERAIGHLDAGAKSCEVMIHASCDTIKQAS